MEEDIKTIQEKLKIIESLCTDDCINKSTVIQPLIYAIENLIARYKETKQELESVKEIYYTQKEIETNYIPKSKVKEKIDSKFKEAKGLYERGVQPQAQFTMKLLRDLEKELL